MPFRMQGLSGEVKWGPHNTSYVRRRKHWIEREFGKDFAKTYGLLGRHANQATGALSGLLNQPGYGFQMSPQWGAEKPNPMYGFRGWDPNAANNKLVATLMRPLADPKNTPPYTKGGTGQPHEYMLAIKNPANLALEQLLRTRQLGDRYQQMADRGILSDAELSRIGGQMDASVDAMDASAGAATEAYRRAAARNRQQMARGANTRQPGAVRARDNMLAGSLDSEAQIGAQYAGQNQRNRGSMAMAKADLLTQSLMGGRQMGLAGVEQANANLGNFIANRGWDTSVENRFGPSAERQLRAQVPMQHMGAQNALAGQWYGDKTQTRRMRQQMRQQYLNNRRMMERQLYLDAYYQNQLADNAKKREGSWGQLMDWGLDLGWLAAKRFGKKDE
jgi:hypothetical protein